VRAQRDSSSPPISRIRLSGIGRGSVTHPTVHGGRYVRGKPWIPGRGLILRSAEPDSHHARKKISPKARPRYQYLIAFRFSDSAS
jgi:hypothetical protein